MIETRPQDCSRIGSSDLLLSAQGPAGNDDPNLIQRLEDELLLHTAALGGAGGSDLQLYSVESDMRFHPEISRRAHQRAPRSLEELSEGDRLRRHCYLVGHGASGLLPQCFAMSAADVALFLHGNFPSGRKGRLDGIALDYWSPLLETCLLNNGTTSCSGLEHVPPADCWGH